jgi:flagellar hook assembly protein FlgD
MVYTVSGRKIKTIDIPPDRLRIGYNVIPWDGRDEDGDRLANGTYFFKVLVRSAGSSLEQIGRIAVLR